MLIRYLFILETIQQFDDIVLSSWLYKLMLKKVWRSYQPIDSLGYQIFQLI